MADSPPTTPRSPRQIVENELWKKEKGPMGAKWARKLVVVDTVRGTIRYHKPNEDKRARRCRGGFRRERGVARAVPRRFV